MNQFVFWCLTLYGLGRILETFWRRKTIKGKIIAPYTLYILVALHSLIFMTVMFEWIESETQTNSLMLVSLGLLSIFGTAVVRNWSIYTLGVYHSIHIEIRDNHQLITNGPYVFMRNPYYVSNAIELIGFPLLAGSFWGIVLSISFYIPCLIFRLMLEEFALEEKFGDSFRAFKSRVPRILPDLM
jgi:protein-S-isoprenylcysteine O-methyltransferase Ste14